MIAFLLRIAERALLASAAAWANPVLLDQIVGGKSLICSVDSMDYLVIRQKSLPHQKDVVCKAAAKGVAAVQVLLSPILERELSCCLQDAQHPSRPAKPLLRNVLGPELRCCLQDFA